MAADIGNAKRLLLLALEVPTVVKPAVEIHI
jgi:hypothetical protein